jgi:hypothetical protein
LVHLENVSSLSDFVGIPVAHLFEVLFAVKFNNHFVSLVFLYFMERPLKTARRIPAHPQFCEILSEWFPRALASIVGEYAGVWRTRQEVPNVPIRALTSSPEGDVIAKDRQGCAH